METIRTLTTPDGYREILANIKTFDSSELTFTPKWIDIKDDSLDVYIAWTGKWELEEDTFEERGLAVIMFRGNPPKVDQILRANPFSYP